MKKEQICEECGGENGEHIFDCSFFEEPELEEDEIEEDNYDESE